MVLRESKEDREKERERVKNRYREVPQREGSNKREKTAPIPPYVNPCPSQSSKRIRLRHDSGSPC